MLARFGLMSCFLPQAPGIPRRCSNLRVCFEMQSKAHTYDMTIQIGSDSFRNAMLFFPPRGSYPLNKNSQVIYW